MFFSSNTVRSKSSKVIFYIWPTGSPRTQLTNNVHNKRGNCYLILFCSNAFICLHLVKKQEPYIPSLSYNGYHRFNNLYGLSKIFLIELNQSITFSTRQRIKSWIIYGPFTIYQNIATFMKLLQFGRLRLPVQSLSKLNQKCRKFSFKKFQEIWPLHNLSKLGTKLTRIQLTTEKLPYS